VATVGKSIKQISTRKKAFCFIDCIERRAVLVTDKETYQPKISPEEEVAYWKNAQR